MADLNWTDDQLRAIRHVGGSLVVSAAAGSGKTAVLAERCVYLTCEAPSENSSGEDSHGSRRGCEREQRTLAGPR